MRLEILGGPFDGGAVDVPRRTTPGLRLQLTSEDVTAFYRIVGTRRGRCEVVFEELADTGSTGADLLRDALTADGTDTRRTSLA